LDAVIGLSGHDGAGCADRAVFQQPGLGTAAVEVAAVGVGQAQLLGGDGAGGEKPHAGNGTPMLGNHTQPLWITGAVHVIPHGAGARLRGR